MSGINPWHVGIPLIGLIIVIVAAWRMRIAIQERKAGFPIRDERTMKIQGRAASYAIQVGSWYMILLLFYNMYIIEVLGWSELGSMPALNSTIILMNVTYLALQHYFAGKEGP
jgi:uncharacterized membrane protein